MQKDATTPDIVGLTCAALRRSRKKRNVGNCWLKSLTGFKLCAATRNNIQEGVETVKTCNFHRGGSRIFFRRGCTRLLLYFNTNKPHSFFFFRRIPVVLENRRSSQGGGVRTPCILPLDPPLFQQCSVRLHVTQTTLSHLFLAVAHAKSITLSEFASRLTPTRIGKRSVKESFSTKGAQTYGRNYDERGGNIRKELQIICKWK